MFPYVCITVCAVVKKSSAAAAPPPGKIRARSNSLASLMFIAEDEDEDAPIEPSRYLQPQTIAGYGPCYMRGDVDRDEACLIIGDMYVCTLAFVYLSEVISNTHTLQNKEYRTCMYSLQVT